MPSADRDVSRERSMSPRLKHSSSDLSKLAIPMWDSSDPDRAPPPLPLNPQNPNASPTKANISENVAAAARALTERARESAGASPYTTNSMRDRSPEKSPTRTPQHKRLQSLQHGNLKDFKTSLEHGRGSDWHNSRPSTPSATRDVVSSSPERMQSPTGSPTTSERQGISGTASDRRSSKSGPRPILGENTPPSATMLAIQNMPHRENDAPLANITNSSHPRVTQNAESILSQMQNLTSIATTLQKEMAALSRRSKDNATDLVSLKEATKTRDEDIRKSLRELVSNARASDNGSLAPPRGDMSRSASAMDFVPRFLETKSYHSPPFTKSVSLPRVPPVHSPENGSELDRANSPAPYSVESAASIAMLEKIIREMGTREAQDRLLSTLSEFVTKSSKDNSDVSKKIEQLVDFIKEKQTSRALVKHNSAAIFPRSDDFQAHAGFEDVENGVKRELRPQSVNIVSEELRQALKKIKDSVAQGGGLTGEVKSLVRELRGEVLGMGRELGRKVEKIGQPQNDLAMVLAEDSANKEEIGRIVQEGLVELKEHMEQLIQTKRRQSSGSAQSRRSIDNSEVYALVKQSLAEQSLEKAKSLDVQQPNFDQEAIINAVKEAYEAYKPEIELQQFGLERDEILQCLKEGLEDYQSARANHDGISRGEVIEAVQEALREFTPPAPVTEAAEIKEEVLIAVRECLENFQPQLQPQEKPNQKSVDLGREDILGAVQEGLGNFRKEGAREIEINREDLFLAVKAGLDNTQTPFGGYGDEVLKSLHDIVEGMRVEFKEYSAANGRDTELVLDTTKDGFESLRVEIESYVDRCRDVTGKDDILDAMKSGMGDIQATVANFISQASRNDSVASKAEMFDYIRSQFEQLHHVFAAHKDHGDNSARRNEHLLETISADLTALKSVRGNSGLDGPNDDVLDAMKEEFEQLRASILDGSASHRDQLLEAVRENLSDQNTNIGSRSIRTEEHEQLISTVKEEFDNIRGSLIAPVLHSGNREAHSEVVLAAIRESTDDLRAHLAANNSQSSGESLQLIKEEFERIRDTLGGSIISESSRKEKTDLLEAIRDGLDGLRENNSHLGGDEASEAGLEIMREELERLRQSISSAMVTGGSGADVDGIVEAIRTGFDDLQDRIGTSLTNAQTSTSRPEGLLSALHEGFNELREEISRTTEKPVDLDMTVSYDILDTLKDGISGIRADIERLKTGGQRLANGDVVISDENQVNEALSRTDFDKLEVLLTRLQIKVEAMDQNVHASQASHSVPTVDSTTREALTGLETMIYELRGTVDILVSRKVPSVSKDDTDAIETLLQNTKAKIDDHLIPSLDIAATKEHLDIVEAVVRLTGESVDSLAAKFEVDMASKDDVAAVYQLLQNADSSIKALKDNFDSENSKKPSKDDLDMIENICDEIKDKVDQLPLADTVPTTEDVEQLTSLVERFKDSHDRFKSQYESDLEITAKAFDDRREESDKIIDQIADLKSVVMESKDEIKSRLKRGNEDVRALDEILQGIEDKIDEAPNAVSDVQEMMDFVNREFERSHATLESIRSTNDEKSSTILGEHEALRAFIAGDLTRTLDDRFSEILARHDEQDKVVGQAAHVVAGKAAQQDELLNESRIMTEDLKLTIEALGQSVSAIDPALRDATDKMGDDAKTVFEKVEALNSRIDANHVDLMGESQVVRQELSKALSNVVDMQDTIANFQPQALANLSNLLSIVGEHYEHSKRHLNVPHDPADKSSIEETIRNSFASLPLPTIEAAPITNSVVHDDTKLHEKLDRLLSFGRLDDARLQDRLDDLFDRTGTFEMKLSNLDQIGGIREQIQATAAEISAISALHLEIANKENQDSKEEARQMAEELVQYRNEKEDLELRVENLTATRKSLAADVEFLMADRDSLTSQKSRLAAEVSSLETALRIRREELKEMDVRADSLERRIIEGVMDHSRALLIAKQPKTAAGMNLKRVPSNASNATSSTTTPSSVSNTGMNIALSRKRSNKKGAMASNPAARRILSLSQITSNVPNGSSVSAPRPILGGLNSLKRSQSVKNPAIRNSSWADQNSVAEYDKENESLFEEGEETMSVEEKDSRVTTSMTNRSISRSGSQFSSSERRTSLDSGPSEYSYATGSYLTGSDSMRTTSYGSTIRSIVEGGSSFESSIQEDEAGEEDQTGRIDALPIDEREEMADSVGDLDYALTSTAPKDLVMRPPDGYDSGLGSDLPTAVATSQYGSDYFPSMPKD